METLSGLSQPGVDILHELETLLVPVHQAQRVLFGLHRHQLLVLPPGDVGGLPAHLGTPARHVEEHPEVQGELRLLLVVVPDEGVVPLAPPGEAAPAPGIVLLLRPLRPVLRVLLSVAILGGQRMQLEAGQV